MSNAAEVIGILHEAAEFIRLARLKIDGAECLMKSSEKFNEYSSLKTEAEEIDINLWAELHNLRGLAQKCDR